MQYYQNVSNVPKTKGVEDRTQPANCITGNSTGTDLDLRSGAYFGWGHYAMDPHLGHQDCKMA